MEVLDPENANGAQGPGALVLLVEDEPQMRRFLRITLRSSGYRIVDAETGEEGIVQASTRGPDVVLLDLGLPDLDGLEVLRRLKQWSDLPVIVVSARGQEQDKVRALDAGADDYLTKPFGAAELRARIRVALRHREARQGAVRDPIFSVGELKVDQERRQVFVGGREVHLTPLEYRLLAVLIRKAGLVLTHAHLLREVWGPGYTNQPQYLRVYMGQLRRKLESDPTRPRILTTEPGVGYRLRVEPTTTG